MEKPSPEIIRYANENGFDIVEPIGSYKGFDAYFLWFSNVKPYTLVGLPWFLLAKDGKPEKLISGADEEHRDLMELMNQDNEDEE